MSLASFFCKVYLVLPHSKSSFLIITQVDVTSRARNTFFVFIGFFIFKGNMLITPKEGMLQGITRQVILDIAPSEFKVEERDINIRELKEADEAFKCGTSNEITPVIQIDEHQIGNAKVGNNTKKLMKMLKEYINQKIYINE